MAKIYIIATPIGNLRDISLRAIDSLKESDLILCEDTRRTLKLLAFYKISKPVLSYHHHSGISKIDHILELLESGKTISLVSDAGTPGISDPGGVLIEKIIEKFNKLVDIIPIPGCSALATAVSISGIPMDRFLFLGFPPAKNKRTKFFEENLSFKYPLVVYESPHRIIKTIKNIVEIDENRQIIVCRELTKMFETVYRGTAKEVLSEIEKSEIKGEFTVIINKKSE